MRDAACSSVAPRVTTSSASGRSTGVAQADLGTGSTRSSNPTASRARPTFLITRAQPPCWAEFFVSGDGCLEGPLAPDLFDVKLVSTYFLIQGHQ